MKNVLFASTALVAFGFAGAAFAEAHASTSISLSGSAELGFTSVDDGAAQDGRIQLHNDFDLVWSLTGTTDGGLTFGATGDWDEAPTEESASAFVSGAFGTITIGDTDDAYDKAMIEAATGGLVDEADFYRDGHDGIGDQDAEGQTGRYDISFGGTTLSVSYEDGKDDGAEDAYGVGAAFSFGSVNMGIGYGEAGDQTVAGISTGVSFGAVGLVLAYEANESAAGIDSDNLQGSVTFDLGAGTVGVNFDLDDTDAAAAPAAGATASGGVEETGYGVWYSMGLGGGATFTVAAGYNEVDTTTVTNTGGVLSSATVTTDETRFGAGIGMSF